MAEAPRDQNFVPSALFESSSTPGLTLSGKINQSTGRILTDAAGGNPGTVTSVSVVTANGFAGSVATATSTPAITLSTTITGILSGNGTAISAASTTGSGAVVLANTPTLITPVLGAATATSINGLTISTSTGTLAVANGKTLTVSNSGTLAGGDAFVLAIAAGKTLTISNSITLAGTDSTTMTFPTTSKTIAANDGTNWTLASQAVGDILTASSSSAYTRLAAVAVGSVLVSAGTGTQPVWSAGPQVTTIELGSATDTTLSRASSGVLAVEGVVVPTISSTNTLTNKRITKRLVSVNAPGATPTTNTDNSDIAEFTGLAADITSMTTNLSGTPVNGDLTEFIFLDNGTARAITWGASFADGGLVTLPTTTVISIVLRVLVQYQTIASLNKWVCVAKA